MLVYIGGRLAFSAVNSPWKRAQFSNLPLGSFRQWDGDSDKTVCLVNTLIDIHSTQWQIQDFPDGGRQPQRVYHYLVFCWKLHKNEENCTNFLHLDPPLQSIRIWSHCLTSHLCNNLFLESQSSSSHSVNDPKHVHTQCMNKSRGSSFIKTLSISLLGK